MSIEPSREAAAFARRMMSAAIRIPDADARADKVMPILAQIEELARKAEALISQNQQP